MRKIFVFANIAVFFSVSGMLFCSRLDDSTDLGANVIDDAFPDKVNTNKHFRHYTMVGSEVTESSSLPCTGDTGFGVHEVTGSSLVLGLRDGQHAAGYVRFNCTPDTLADRRFGPDDTLRSVIIRFIRDTAVPKCHIAVWRSEKRAHALSPSTANGDSLLNTMEFAAAADSCHNVPDSVVLRPGGLTDSIFKACTTSNKPSAQSIKTVFGFIVYHIENNGIVRLAGNPSLQILCKHGTDTAVKSVSYSSSGTSWYCADDGNADTLQKKPWMWYSSKRTALYRYNVKRLWDSAGADPKRAEILSATLSLKAAPAPGDTLRVRYLLWNSLVRNGAELDSLFVNNTVSPAGTVYLSDTAVARVSVLTGLSGFEQGTRDSTLYFYMRFVEDAKQTWKRYLWTGTPLLRATIGIQ